MIYARRPFSFPAKQCLGVTGSCARPQCRPHTGDEQWALLKLWVLGEKGLQGVKAVRPPRSPSHQSGCPDPLCASVPAAWLSHLRTPTWFLTSTHRQLQKLLRSTPSCSSVLLPLLQVLWFITVYLLMVTLHEAADAKVHRCRIPRINVEPNFQGPELSCIRPLQISNVQAEAPQQVGCVRSSCVSFPDML